MFRLFLYVKCIILRDFFPCRATSRHSTDDLKGNNLLPYEELTTFSKRTGKYFENFYYMMLLLYNFIAIAVILGCVRSLNIPSKRLHEIQGTGDDTYKQLARWIKYLLNPRRSEQQDMMKEYLLKSLLKDNPVVKTNMWLRQAMTTPEPSKPGPTPKDEMPNVVEKQLEHALAKKPSALYDKPYILKKGDREFLVLHPGDLDPFVTVIPNDIYYSVQKKCVNWLEDCNEQGIRSQLFQKLKSPY